jgi:hypothetical protein
MIELETLNDTIIKPVKPSHEIVNDMYSLYMGNKFMVKKIYHITTGENINHIIRNYDGFEFNVGMVIVSHNFMSDIFQFNQNNSNNKFCFYVVKTSEIFNIDSPIYFTLSLEKSNYTGVFYEYNMNGSVITRCSYINGIREGLFTVFYNDGSKNVYFQTSFVHGTREGLCTVFNKNGKIISSTYFVNNFEEGPRINFLDDGIEEGQMLKGERNGLWKITPYEQAKFKYSFHSGHIINDSTLLLSFDSYYNFNNLNNFDNPSELSYNVGSDILISIIDYYLKYHNEPNNHDYQLVPDKCQVKIPFQSRCDISKNLVTRLIMSNFDINLMDDFYVVQFK